MALELTSEQANRLKKHLETSKKLGAAQRTSPERMDEIRNRVADGQNVPTVTRELHCASRLYYKAKKELGMI